MNYKLLLTSLGMSMRNDMTKSVNKGLSLTERLVSRHKERKNKYVNFSLSYSACWSICHVEFILQFIYVDYRNESAYQVNVESVKKQAVVNVVLKKLRDRLQMRGLTLQQCLMDTSRSSASVLDLRDFQKVW